MSMHVPVSAVDAGALREAITAIVKEAARRGSGGGV